MSVEANVPVARGRRRSRFTRCSSCGLLGAATAPPIRPGAAVDDHRHRVVVGVVGHEPS